MKTNARARRESALPYIPPVLVDVRHPRLGWHTVYVGHHKGGQVTFEEYCRLWPEYSVTMKEVSGPQSWSVLMSRAGTYHYIGA